MMESSMKRSILFAGSVVAALALTPAYADSPRHFLRDALQGDNSEIMLGRLASDQARSPAVRYYCQTLVSDHRQARDEVLSAGSQFGLRRDRDIAPEARDERDKLLGLHGRDFDREFVRYMVDDHRKDISAFRDEAREDHGAASDLARSQLPTLRKHLRMAIALDRSDGRSSEGGQDMARDRDGHDYDRDNRDHNWQR